MAAENVPHLLWSLLVPLVALLLILYADLHWNGDCVIETAGGNQWLY